PVTTLAGVGLQDLVHLVTAVACDPVVRLDQQGEGGSTTLERARVAGDGLEAGSAAQGVDELLAQVDAELGLHLVGDERREQGERVDRLLLADGDDLDPRVGVALADRQAVLPVREAARAAELDHANDRQERVLAVALEALDHALPIGEPPVLIDGVPPQEQPELLERELPGLALVAQPPGAPLGDLPAERPLRQEPVAVVVGLPARADLYRVAAAEKVLDLLDLVVSKAVAWLVCPL